MLYLKKRLFAWFLLHSAECNVRVYDLFTQACFEYATKRGFECQHETILKERELGHDDYQGKCALCGLLVQVVQLGSTRDVRPVEVK